MKLRHLNCATLRPLGGGLIHGAARPHQRTELVTHCLLLETARGLVLIDTGLGTADVDGRRGRGHRRHLKMLLWAALRAEEPAANQLRRLGYDPDDVRDIVLTHLDLDHAGGLADFPGARVHVARVELDAARARASIKERVRYTPIDWAHGPRWVPYELGDGDPWLGLPGARAIEGVDAEIVMVPLPGHTRGHAGVAVRGPAGWVLHAGDAYVFQGELEEGVPSPASPAIEAFQTLISSVDDRRRRATRTALRDFAAAQRGRVTLLSAHDPDRFEQLAGARARTYA